MILMILGKRSLAVVVVVLFRFDCLFVCSFWRGQGVNHDTCNRKYNALVTLKIKLNTILDEDILTIVLR